MLWQIFLLQDPPSLKIISPQDGAELSEPHVFIQGETVPNAIVNVNGERAIVSSDGQFRYEFDVPRGLSVITIESRRRYGSPVQEIRRVTYIPKPPP